MTDILARQRQLIGTTQEWADNDLVIGDGEIAIEREPLGSVLFKIGDGATAYASLPYYGGGGPNASGPHFATEEEMFSDTGMTYGPGPGTVMNAGDPVFTGEGAFIVADEAATEFDAETAGGVKLLRLSGFNTVASLQGSTALTAANSADGTAVKVGAYEYVVDSAAAAPAITTAGGAQMVVAPTSPYIIPDMFAQNEGPATTDMTAALQAAANAAQDQNAPLVFMLNPMKVSDTINLPPSVQLQGNGGSRYANTSGTAGARVVNYKITEGAVVKLSGTRLQSQGGATRGLTITSGGAGRTTDLTGVDLVGLGLDTMFNHVIEDLTVEHFNGRYAVDASDLSGGTSNQCNKLVFVRPRILIVGDRVADNPAGTYGGGLYLVSCADSEILDPYIETVNGIGAYVAGNSKILNGFIDLCDRGVGMNGENILLSNTSAKFHKRNAVALFTTENAKIADCKLISGNTGRGGIGDPDTATVRLSGASVGASIKNTDMRHVQQWRGPRMPMCVHTGALGNTLSITGSYFGDVALGEVHIASPSGMWSAGNLTFRDNFLEMGSSRSTLQTPVPFASGLVVNNDTFTVTYMGDTYVANGRGHSFPWTTTATFGYDPAEDTAPDNGANDWVKLEDRDHRGLVVPPDVSMDVGTFTVSTLDGSTEDSALSLSRGASVSGTVVTNNVAILQRGGRATRGPFYRCKTKPLTLIDMAGVSTGASSLSGVQVPVQVNHSGSSLNELFPIFEATANHVFSGRIQISGAQAGAPEITMDATVAWDGTDLTVDVLDIDVAAFAGSATFVVDSGALCLQASSAIATDVPATVVFEGTYTLKA